VTVLAAQMQVALADELAELNERFYQTVAERVEAGESSPVEQTRAQVTLATAHIARDQARLTLEIARNELAASWGDDTATFDSAIGLLKQVDPIPPRAQLTALLDQNPDIARWETEAELQRVRLSLERANAIPDLTLSAGIADSRDTDDNAFVIGASIPFPVFDRNQGGIAAAHAARSQAQQESIAARNQAQLNLATSFRNLKAAYYAASTLQTQILPAAQEAFEAVDFGYRAGKFSFLEVLDAQRTLFEAREQYIEAMATYHQARTEVERLIGIPLQTVEQQSRVGE
jgi:cobalt-zinc-cadmium efflux system outer membrane protein